MRLSVLMPVYAKEHPAFLERALGSIQRQSLPANEVVLVKDGPLTAELEKIITAYSNLLPIQIVALPSRIGLGEALRSGVDRCRGEWIARMDSDDVCVGRRFELQAAALAANPELDGVGGAIAEFASDPEHPMTYRRPPAAMEEIARTAKFRNPFNHMTVMLRREAVLKAGNYGPFSDFEDYHLWIRMLMAGSRFANLNEVLVHARTGDGMLRRRGGLKYVRAEIAFQRFLCASGFVSPARAVGNAFLRAPVRLAPPPLRRLVYRRMLRSSQGLSPNSQGKQVG